MQTTASKRVHWESQGEGFQSISSDGSFRTRARLAEAEGEEKGMDEEEEEDED